MRKITTTILSLCLLPALSFAANKPQAPTSSDVGSFSTCAAYATKVGTYLQDLGQSKSGTYTDLMNGFWFQNQANDSNYGGTAIINDMTYTYVSENGNQIFGADHACYVLTGFSSSTNVRNELLKSLKTKYDLAVNKGTSVGGQGGYGVYGKTSSCSLPNKKYSGCQLLIGSINA